MENTLTLEEHDKRSQDRYVDILKVLDSKPMKENHMASEDNTAALIAAMMGNRGGDHTGAAVGGGLGAGFAGGVIGGALLGGNGILGNRNGGEGVVTPSQLQSAINGVISNNDVTATLQGIADIKAAVPLAQAQTSLAVAASASDVRNALGQVENVLVAGQEGLSRSVSEAIAASLASQGNINVNVLTQGSTTREAVNAMGVANLQATKESQFATAAAIAASTEKVLAAIKDGEITTLNRELAVAQAALAEQRAVGRAAATEVNVTQNVTQSQVQLDIQRQSQQQAILLSQLAAAINGMQNAVATNSSLIVGNSGAVSAPSQTANPVNVRT